MPSALSVLNTIVGEIVSTSVAFATELFTNYWGYVLVVGAIAGIVVLFKKLGTMGAKG